MEGLKYLDFGRELERQGEHFLAHTLHSRDNTVLVTKHHSDWQNNRALDLTWDAGTTGTMGVNP